MKKLIRLTESELVSLVKRVIKEQSSTKLKLKRGDILTVVKKNDTSKSPVEMLAGVSASYDSGMGQRIEVKVTGGDKVQIDFDPVKMEFGDYKIVKVNGELINKPIAKPQPTKQSIKPGGAIPTQFINIVNILTNKLVIKLNSKYDLRWSEGKAGGVPQLVGKTDKGENVILDFECGMREGQPVFIVIRYNNGQILSGNFMALNQIINTGNYCPVG